MQRELKFRAWDKSQKYMDHQRHPNLTEMQSYASCLRLPLVAKWFEMTKAGIKTEDYREINEYWLKRLFFHDWRSGELDQNMIDEVICELNKFSYSLKELDRWADFKPKHFNINVMTLGYPKSNNSERILKLEHKGIEIRTGNAEWGAVPNKLYFVIMHGAILT